MVNVWLLAKSLAIFLATLGLCVALYGTRAHDRRTLVVLWLSAVAFLATGSLFVVLSWGLLSWEIFLFTTRSWTLLGDVVLIFISAGYSFAILALVNTVRHLLAGPGK